MGKYFLYHMRKTVIRFIVMALFLGVIVNMTAVAERTVYNSSATYYNVSLAAFAAFSLFAPAIVAGLEFAQFMNRRNLDTWYSLPISRTDLFIVHFLNGAIQLTVSLFLGVIVAFIRIAICSVLEVSHLWMFFAIIWALTMFLYMVVTFLFVCANNVFDGCIFMFGSVLFPAELYSIFLRFYIAFRYGSTRYAVLYDTGRELPFDGFGIFSMLFTATDRYGCLINTRPYSYVTQGMMPDPAEFSMPQVLLWTMLSVAALAGAVLVFSKKKTENVSGLSESWFGYRTLIPVVTAAGLCSTAYSAAMGMDRYMGVISMLGLIPTFIGVFVAYVIYRRGVKFKLPDILSIVGLVVFYPICLLAFKMMMG